MDDHRVLVVSVSVGAGHDGAADELVRRLRQRGVEAHRRDFLDALPPFFTLLHRQFYRISVGSVPRLYEWGFQRLEHPGWVQRTTFQLCRIAARDPAVGRWARRGGVDAPDGQP